MGTGSTEASSADLDFIINYCHTNLNAKKIFLAGHSFGGNTIISYFPSACKKIDGIIPLDCDYAYELQDFQPVAYNPLSKEKQPCCNLPIFAAARKKAHFKLVDSFSLATRYFLNIAGMSHADFVAQGIIGRYYCLAYAKDSLHYRHKINNYLLLCDAVLQFLNAYSSGNVFRQENIVTSKDWKFNVIEPGKKLPSNMPFDLSSNACPSISQFADIVYYTGLKYAGKLYTQCAASSLNNPGDLVDILGFIYTNSAIDSTLAYLEWLNNTGIARNNLSNILQAISDNSSFEGSRRSRASADSIYNWMLEKYPASKYGYMGKILAGIDNHIDSNCNKILAIEPGFLQRKPANSSEYFVAYIMKQVLKMAD